MKTKKTLYILLAIILLSGALRLVGIQHPLLGHQSWRQADTAAMARNFVQERFNILYPRIDWRGNTTGEVECEFPIYQFMLASLYALFGVHESLGRLLSVFFSLLTIPGIYLLGKRIARPSVGLWAAFFFAVLPLPLFFGRAVMPEALLVAACTYAVLLFLHWYDNGSRLALFASAVVLALACLIKPPTLYLGLPLAYLAFRKHGLRAMLRPELWLFAALVVASLAGWYYHAHQLKEMTGLTFGVWEYGSDKWGNWDLVGSWDFWERILMTRIFANVLSYAGLPLLLIGLIRRPVSTEERVFSLWLLGMGVFTVIVARGVFVHDYYLLPAAIPVSYYLGKTTAWALDRDKRPARWLQVIVGILILATTIISLDTYRTWLGQEDPADWPAYQVAQLARRELEPDALVIAVDKGNPLMLYYARKKGWRSFPPDLTPGFVKALSSAGAEYILGVHQDFAAFGAEDHRDRLLARHATVVDNGNVFIVKIER
jgi:4-amino-4-deoxy-L-arabinose transferase-like glycosyltransferase